MAISEELANDLEDLASAFMNATGAWHRPQPAKVWHLAPFDGLVGILRSQRIWLTGSATMKDASEVNWGNELTLGAARELRRTRPHPALDALLDTWGPHPFVQGELYAACFTDVPPCPEQWEKRGARSGGALEFDAEPLGFLNRRPGGTGLLRVHYDARRVAGLAVVCLRAMLDKLDSRPGEYDADDAASIAYYMLEVTALARHTKKECFSWESEWRLVQRAWVSADQIIESPNPEAPETPRRRVELSLTSDGPAVLVAVHLGPDLAPSERAEIAALVAQSWPGVGLRDQA